VVEIPAPTAASATGGCTALPYAGEVDLPEASGAAWMGDALVVISDSGNHGRYLELDGAGTIIGRGQLPLGGAGDDLEGLAADGDTLWGLTSGGWMRGWQRDGVGWRLAVDAYAIDPTSRCQPGSVNCGANFEGVCLSPRPLADGCDGYAAAKSSGTMFCLHRADGRFTLDATRGFRAAAPEQLADCAIAEDGAVWTGDNGFGLMMVRRWTVDAEGAHLTGAEHLGLGFPEVLAFGPAHAVYRFSDLGGSPSLALAFSCPTGLPKAGPAAPAQ